MFGRLAPVTFDISARARFELIPTGERKKRTNQTINHNIGQFFFHSVCCVVLKGKRINSLCNYGTKIVSFQHFSMLHRHISGSFYLEKTDSDYRTGITTIFGKVHTKTAAKKKLNKIK